MIKKYIFLLLLMPITIVAFANGDPVESRSALFRSSNPSPRTITDVQLLSEKLYIQPGSYSYITVKYVLWNNSDKDYNDIDYGFPVDYYGYGKELENSGIVGYMMSESSGTIGWQDDYIKEIAFYFNGEKLSYVASEEAVVHKEPTPKWEDYDSKREELKEDDKLMYEVDSYSAIASSIARRWFYTKFSIKADQIVELEVRYAIRNSQNISFYGDYLRQGTNCHLTYDLSPASHWGDGRIRDFYVQVDATEFSLANPYFGKDESEEDISLSGLPFQRTGNIYSYRTNNFQLKDAVPITIDYVLKSEPSYTQWLKNRISNGEYTITATGTNPKYPIANLNDMDFSTAWVSSKNGGIGEKITITFKERIAFIGIIVLGGYHKSKATYEQNNRISRLDVYIYGNYLYDGADIDNWVDDVTLITYYTGQDAAYTPVYFENLQNTSFLGYGGTALNWQYNSLQLVSKLELTIEDIIPGSKYNDACISEIIILGKPMRELISTKNKK